MKTWKQGIIGILAIIALTFAFITCDNDNGDKHTHEWEWKETTPATYDTEGLETEICKTCGATNGTRPITKLEKPCDCQPDHLQYYDDECDCDLKDCNCVPTPYQMWQETIPIYLMSGVTNQDTAISNLNDRFEARTPAEQAIIARNIEKIIIVPGTNLVNIDNQENGKYIAEIGENATATRIGSQVLNAILNAPLDNGV